MFRPWPIVLALVALGAGSARPAPRPETVAEASGFRATSTLAETLTFLEEVAATTDAIALSSFGTSAAGRPLPLVIVGDPGLHAPGPARASGKPIVMLQSGIHAGEIDGKVASLMLLREIAGGRAAWAKDMVLLIVPIYNVDGHERVSPWNRPNQDGPVEGMGFRTTADGHDLNRDHLKLDTPEARALMRLVNAWRPHLHVDNHITNGSEHDWVLTWSVAEAPQLAAPVDAWVREHLATALEETARRGHRVGPYVWLLDGNDPAQGFDSRVTEPRYATGYWPLRNRASILVENHAHKPFEARVRANHELLRRLLDRVAADGADLVAAVAEAERQAPGRPRATLRYEADDVGDTISFPAYEWSLDESRALGAPLLRYRTGKIRDVEVKWIHRNRPEVTVSRPRGYLVDPGWPTIEERLSGHGLPVSRLEAPCTVAVESIRLESLPFETPGTTYQGRTRTAPEVRRTVETRTFPAGALWIDGATPDFDVAIQLLEPEAPDSLVAWGIVSQVVERKEYIDSRTLEAWVRETLPGNEALGERWRDALAAEPGLEDDPGRRWLWWYRQTPWWDDTVGLFPAARALKLPDCEIGPPETARAEATLLAGPWRARLESPGGALPFGLELGLTGRGWRAVLENGDESSEVARVRFDDGELVLELAPYDARVRARLSADGGQLVGSWVKTVGDGDESRLPFRAERGAGPRYPFSRRTDARPLSGRYRVEFERGEAPAVAELTGRADGTVRGTFLTETGDYRYLAGRLEGDRLRLSVFDGAHAFLFDATRHDDGSLAGDFWSRDRWHETWTAVPAPDAKLRDPFELTVPRETRLSELAFPDLTGAPRRLDDPAFAGRARIVEVFGSWCPNCNDSARFLAELDRTYRDRGLSILGLAFEVTGDFARDAEQVDRFRRHHGIEYPLLLAGTADKDEASAALPLIDRVRSFPTTVFLDRHGRVRAVHQGYAGPAAGREHDELRERYRALVEELLSE